MNSFDRTTCMGFVMVIVVMFFSAQLEYREFIIGCYIAFIILLCITVNAIVELWNRIALNSNEGSQKTKLCKFLSEECAPEGAASAKRLERESWLASSVVEKPKEKLKAPPEEYINGATSAERESWLEWMKKTFRLPSSRTGDYDRTD